MGQPNDPPATLSAGLEDALSGDLAPRDARPWPAARPYSEQLAAMRRVALAEGDFESAAWVEAEIARGRL